METPNWASKRFFKEGKGIKKDCNARRKDNFDILTTSDLEKCCAFQDVRSATNAGKGKL